MKENESLMEKLESEFSSDFAKNANSPLLNKIFGKIWAVDKSMTVENIQDLDKMPEALRNMILATFDLLLLLISDRAICMLNIGNEDMKAYYRIVGETSDYVKIYAVPTSGKAGRELSLSILDNRLIFDAKSASSPKMFFKEASPDQLNGNQSSAIQEKLENAALQFMGEMTTSLKDIFGKK